MINFNPVLKLIFIFSWILILEACTPFQENYSVIEIEQGAMKWDKESYNYGSVSVGLQSTAQSFKIKNTGNIVVKECGPILLSDALNFSLVSNFCTAHEMNPGAECEVQVVSHPLTIGTKSLTLSRVCADGVVVSTLQGNIAAEGIFPVMAWSPLVKDFGSTEVGSPSASQTFILTNSAGAAASGCGSPVISDISNFTILSNTCSSSDLAVSNSCQITVRANPSYPGLIAATISRSCTVGGTVSTTMNQITVYAGTPSMATARYIHGAVVMSDGKIFVMGGVDVTNSIVLNQTEMYDPSLKTWSNQAPMTVPRHWVSAIRLPSGQVLAAGGGTTGALTNTVELYNPALNTWTMKASLSGSRHLHTISLLADGKVLVVGGNTSTSQSGGSGSVAVELYDPALNTWTTKASLPAPRFFHQTQVLQNGKVLVMGGFESGGRTNSVVLYDPALNSWTSKAPLNNDRSQFSSGILPDGRVIVAGGYSSGGALASVEIYDPALNSWTLKAPMSTSRFYPSLTVRPDGQVLEAGGFDGSFIAQTSVEVFDPAANSWTAQVNMAEGRFLHTASILPDGKVLICGGTSNTTIHMTCYTR